MDGCRRCKSFLIQDFSLGDENPEEMQFFPFFQRSDSKCVGKPRFLTNDAVGLGFGALAGSRALNPTFSAGLWNAHSGYFELKGMAAREIHGLGGLGRVG